MSKQLKCKDLKPGDILLKFSDGSLLSGIIKTGEKLLDKKENSDSCACSNPQRCKDSRKAYGPYHVPVKVPPVSPQRL